MHVVRKPQFFKCVKKPHNQMMRALVFFYWKFDIQRALHRQGLETKVSWRKVAVYRSNDKSKVTYLRDEKRMLGVNTMSPKYILRHAQGIQQSVSCLNFSQIESVITSIWNVQGNDSRLPKNLWSQKNAFLEACESSQKAGQIYESLSADTTKVDLVLSAKECSNRENM